MVEVDLKDENGGMIASSSRATMLPYECDMVSTIRKCILIAPLIFGWMSEVKRVIVPSLDHFVESFEQPLASVEIRLVTFNSNLNFAQKKSFSPVIQVIHAELWIGKKLNILQRLMKEFFITCFIFGTFLLIVIQGLCIFSLKACYDIYYSSRKKLEMIDQKDSVARQINIDMEKKEMNKKESKISQNLECKVSLIDLSPEQLKNIGRTKNDLMTSMNDLSEDEDIKPLQLQGTSETGKSFKLVKTLDIQNGNRKDLLPDLKEEPFYQTGTTLDDDKEATTESIATSQKSNVCSRTPKFENTQIGRTKVGEEVVLKPLNVREIVKIESLKKTARLKTKNLKDNDTNTKSEIDHLDYYEIDTGLDKLD